MYELDLEKAEDPAIKLPTSTEKATEFQKNIYFCITDHAKAFDCVDHFNCGKFLKRWYIPDHLTYYLRNLHAGQEAAARNLHGTNGKGVVQN